MKKMGLIRNTERMGKYELEKGYASYKTIIEHFIGDIILCNNIANVDDSIWDNINDDYYEIADETADIYQFYLCNLTDFQTERARKAGLIISYSDMLECNVLCVDHFGTAWDYVLTDVKLFDNYEDLEAYEKGSTSNE